MRRERAEALPDDVSDEGLEAEKAGEKAQVNLALGRMSEEDRELLILRYMNEESLRDISRITGLSRFALYRKLNRVKKEFMRLMEGGGTHE
jgi:RNA polymerase sigma-70 factor (ECF subfamily)